MIQLTLSGLPFATRVTADENVLAHTHDFYEFLIMTEGNLTNIVNGEDDVLEVGDMVVIPPDISHAFILTQKCVHRDIMVSPTLFHEACKFMGIHDVNALFKEKQYIKRKLSAEAVKVLEQFLSAYTSSDDITLRTKEERAVTAQLVGLTLFPTVNEAYALSDFKTQCVSLIGEKFVSPDAIKIICDYFHYNQSYMCEKFKRVFGITMTDYINDLRIARAAYLLSVSSYSLREICDSIGFNSLSYFNKLFKEKHAISPAKYRKQSASKPHSVSIT